MTTIISDDVLDQIEHVEKVNREHLEKYVPEHPARMQRLIAEGGFFGCLSSHSIITVAALKLSQISCVMHGNWQQAREYLAIPLGLECNFDVLAKLVHEGIQGIRLWDGERLSLVGRVEHLLCYLLLNRTAEIGVEYAAFRQKELFIEYDLHNWGAIFSRHLILASQSCYAEIRIEDYAKSKMKKNDFLHEAHTALIALAQGDEAKFAQEMAACCEAFKKRKKSRLLGTNWGYGVASHFCFDIVGTALYRLAVQRGLQFPMPEQRYYPVEFWRD